MRRLLGLFRVRRSGEIRPDDPQQTLIAVPLWASVGPTENKHLHELLTLASTSYGRQTDWFLRHYDTGVRNLAAVLTAESALMGLSATHKDLPAMFTVGVLLLLVCIAVVLSVLAIISCRQSYKAALESVFLMAEVVWSMGLMRDVQVDMSGVSGSGPGWQDPTLYPPRWYEDMLQYATSKEFVKHKLKNRDNTLFMAKLTIIVFGVGTCCLGLAGAGWLLVR